MGEIEDLLGEDGISTDDEILLAHGYSEWSSTNIETLPVAVAFPTNTEEVSKIAKICMKYKVPISKTLPDTDYLARADGTQYLTREAPVLKATFLPRSVVLALIS